MSTARKTEYIYDEKGKKKAVILPIDKYEELLEDLDDLRTIQKRRSEKSVSFNEVKKLRKKIHG